MEDLKEMEELEELDEGEGYCFFRQVLSGSFLSVKFPFVLLKLAGVYKTLVSLCERGLVLGMVVAWEVGSLPISETAIPTVCVSVTPPQMQPD